MQTRRHFLWEAGGGFGSIALAWMSQREASGSAHFPARARRAVQVFAAGGVSHVDTFDYKPGLDRHDGKSMSGKRQVDPFFGKPGNLMKSVWPFRPRGASGLWVSDLLPHIAACADDIALIRSMYAQSNNHTPATFQMNSGFMRNGFPCLGSWLSYGLGAATDDLPAFVVLPDPRGVPAGGSINWTNGFLPAAHQGVAFRPSGEPIPDLSTPPAIAADRRKAGMELLDRMNRRYLETHSGDTTLAARIRGYELAARMQVSIPEVIDFSQESEATKRLYGLDSPVTAAFGRNCLLARRLLDRGVRFVQLYHGGAFGTPRINWDAHENVKDNHAKQAEIMDKPVAGLLQDLKARGMLEDTLVIWTTEFGRTPFTQGLGEPGRDHHPDVFTCWLAGAGLKKGFSYGSSDEVGFEPGENPVSIYDFHATILHLLGLDHKRLTYYHNGIQRRLTDVHGEVVRGLLA
jgi:hypothetical protein